MMLIRSVVASITAHGWTIAMFFKVLGLPPDLLDNGGKSQL